ncbi:MAG TPA: Rieske 2Fe-2S domain-containing protein [Allosphingosinicella sp.]|nr:Rieske 2Fe-2S domain-containing protein [Allosphingosinicella sp.]
MTASIDSNPKLHRIFEEADFVHTGPGTLAGNYLRRYWQPIHVSEELPQGKIVPIRILGEDLALYRGESGKPHVMTNECPHRLTVLSTGWIEGETIRCRYHGWRYDESGQCVEQPAEAKPFCSKVPKIASYPCHEAHGLIFAYFGEGEAPAFRPLPGLEDGASENWTLSATAEMLPCNWFQSAENIMDDVHVNFSHQGHFVNTVARPFVPTKTWARETPFGLTQLQQRGDVTDQIHFIMPNQCFLAHALRTARDDKPFWFKALFWYVPIDDESHLHVLIMVYHTKRRERPAATPVHEEIEAILSGRKSWEDVAKHPNLIRIQDGVAIVGQGKIVDRSRERLGTSDVAVGVLRRLWRRELKLLAAGKPVTQFGTPDPQALRQEELDAMGFNA